MHKPKPHPRKTRVGIRDLRSNLSRYIRRASNGQIIEVTSREEVVAELRPPVAAMKDARRKAGTLKGKIRIASDFDTTPAELLDSFEA